MTTQREAWLALMTAHSADERFRALAELERLELEYQASVRRELASMARRDRFIIIGCSLLLVLLMVVFAELVGPPQPPASRPPESTSQPTHP